MKIDSTRLDTLIRDVELQIVKTNHLDNAGMPISEQQQKKMYTACIDLIEELLIILNELEKTESKEK